MVMGFKLNLKWASPVRSPFFTGSSRSWPSSYPFRGRDALYDSARMSFALVIAGHGETSNYDPWRENKCFSALQSLDKDYSEMEESEMKLGRSAHDILYTMLDSNIQIPAGEDKLSYLTSLQASKTSRFGLLMENLDLLEATFTDIDVVRLEKDILTQLERIGALKLFHACLSGSLKSGTNFHSSGMPTRHIDEPLRNIITDAYVSRSVIRSRRREKRKTRSERASGKPSALTLPRKTNDKNLWQPNSLARIASNSKSRRQVIAKNEAEMAKGVKLVANLERIRRLLEEETGRVPSLSSWAEAAGVEEKALQQQLHFGWYCRDEVLRSTCSLVLYLARNCRGQGVAFEDLIQAGKCGVLQGAERFDHTRGYRFSTYIQYWIRKSMSALVALHARGIRIPYALNKAINQIHRARNALNNSHMKYPDDEEIAKFTGLSLAKITSASKCLRVVGSTDQQVGNGISAKVLEFIPDALIKDPDKTVMRQHMMQELHGLLDGLDPREKQVLVLRFGLGKQQCRSLEEIGRLFSVSKEWIRKIERTALTKLREEENCRNLSHYSYL